MLNSRTGITKTTILFAIIATTILLVLFNTVVRFQDFIAVFNNADAQFLIISMLIACTGPVLSTLRWNEILSITGNRLPFNKAFTSILAAWPLSVIPGRLGDFGRAYPVRKEIPLPNSTGSILFEKVMDIVVLLVFMGTALLILGGTLYGTALLIFAVSFLPVFFVTTPLILNWLPESISSKLETILNVFALDTLRHKNFYTAAAVSALNWSQSFLEIWLLFRAFKISAPIIPILAYFPVAIFVGLLPVSIAGVGTRDSVMIAFFKSFATPAQILAVGLGYSVIGYFLFAIIGIPFLIREFRFSSN